MDAKRFDRLIADAARRPTRRTTFRILAGGLVGTLLPGRAARAQRTDSDGDLLYDDDETNLYGTDPFAFDTDGDGVGDGEEIYNRDNGLGGNTDPLVNENAAPPPPALVCGVNEMDCGGFCVNYVTDPQNCGYCGRVCPFGTVCDRASCGAPPCVGYGESCYTDFNCCAGRCAKRGEFAKGICERI
jgi:hypothetical protein